MSHGVKSNNLFHKVATCRKLTRAQELLRKDKHRYWNEKKTAGRNNTSRYTKKHQTNEVDEANSVNNKEYQYDEENVNTNYEEIDEISFPYSCLLYTSPSPRDATLSRMPSSA